MCCSVRATNTRSPWWRETTTAGVRTGVKQLTPRRHAELQEVIWHQKRGRHVTLMWATGCLWSDGRNVPTGSDRCSHTSWFNVCRENRECKDLKPVQSCRSVMKHFYCTASLQSWYFTAVFCRYFYCQVKSVIFVMRHITNLKFASALQSVQDTTASVLYCTHHRTRKTTVRPSSDHRSQWSAACRETE